MPTKGRTQWTVSVVESTEAEGGIIATITELPGFCAKFRSKEEMLGNIVDKIYLYQKTVKENNLDLIEYIKNPSLEGYARCRRLGYWPDYPTFGGNSALGHVEDILKDTGISHQDFVGILDADNEVLSRISLKLIENVVLARNLKLSGETHVLGRSLALRDELIDWLICCMLDGLRWNGIEEIPVDLLVLIRSRLIPGESKIEAKLQQSRMKQRATWIAASAIASGKNPSFRFIARFMKVEASTVMRWFESEQEFRRAAEHLVPLFQEDGSLKPLL